ncbi:phenylalanine--tRNA ligase subunit beta [Candidatus Providencia siddallii]|uniref:Phenylalanine--tRNA ligase beta subunit n=1 Tax=Candidatus Providencia siddallii TaxID=1715285 RepID=A0ABP1CE79_9GAMM
MKFSELWLREWLNTTINSKELFNKITMSGLEVNKFEPVAKKFNGVIIGEIIECIQDKKINNLFITKINIGKKNLLNVICYSQNCKIGLKVAVATINSVLSKHFKLKKTKIHKNFSEGFICSYFDLGIHEYKKEIIEFEKDAKIGDDVYNYLKLNDNTVEITIPQNRPDCLSIFGIARELSITNKIKLNKISIDTIIPKLKNTLFINVNAPNACPKILYRIIKNINIFAKTPIYIKEKLRRCGIDLKNTIFNITNYVLLELGQPIQIYDLNKINGTINVRMANNNEIFISSNNIKKKLKINTLVISDDSKILGIAGISYSPLSEIDKKTKNIILECAFFNPNFIKGRSHYYKLQNDISSRFERGIDYKIQNKAIEYTTKLILEICGGDISELINITNKTYLPKKINIKLTRNKLDRIIGYFIDDDIVTNILIQLGCEFFLSKNIWNVFIPTWRFDIQIEENLIEEIARIYGYNNIPKKPLLTNLTIKNKKIKFSLNRIKLLLVDRGFQEAITYSFVNPKIQNLLHPQQKSFILTNPISDEMSAMRLSLWTGLLNSVIYNQNRQQNKIKLFETGICFLHDLKSKYKIKQKLMLAGVIAGNKFEEHWSLNKQSVDFFDLKGDIETIFELTNKLNSITFKKEKHSALHPGKSASIFFKNKKIGYIGNIHPILEENLNLSKNTIIFEIRVDILTEYINNEIKEVSNYPSNRRDISIIVPEDIATADILKECKNILKNNITNINLFDVYKGEKVKKGCKSIGISFIFQNYKRTMEDKEIITMINLCLSILKKQFNAYLRN